VAAALRTGDGQVSASTWPTIGGGKIPLRRILVVQTQRLGDVVVLTPMLTALKRQFPEAHLTALVHRPHDVALQNNPDIDAVITYDRQKQHRSLPARLKLAQELRAGNYDWALCIHAASSVALAVGMAGIPWRTVVWRYAKERPPHWSRLFHQHVKQDRRALGRHEVEHNLDVLRELGIEPDHSGLRVVVTQVEREWASAFLTQTGWDPTRRLAILHPGHGGGRQCWPAEHFVSLAQALIADGLQVGLTGAGAEVPQTEAIAVSIEAPVLRFAGRTNLRKLLAVIERASLFVSVPTGPMHLAAALRVPTVALYGPTDLRVDVTRFHPYGPPYHAVESNIVCPCDNSHRCLDPVCMTDIDPLRVLTAARDLLRRDHSPTE
jgi:predicted lipopolysaccharide heptosyltransferase III